MKLCDEHIERAEGFEIQDQISGWGASCSVIVCSNRSNVGGHVMWHVWHSELKKAGPDYNAGKLSKSQFYQIAERLLGLPIVEAQG